MPKKTDTVYSNHIYIHTHHKGVYDHILQGLKWSESITDYGFYDFENSDQLLTLTFEGHYKKRLDEILTMLSGVARALITVDNFPNALSKRKEPQVAVYQHKCPTCVYVETYRGYDIYTHQELADRPNNVTYLGRYGDFDGQYISDRYGVNSVADFKSKVIDKLCMLHNRSK